MYLDADGDLAHEFYEQCFDKSTGQIVMIRLQNVTPQVS